MGILFLKVEYLINKIQTVTFINFKGAVSFHELFEKVVVLRASFYYYYYYYYYYFNKALETIPKVPRQKPKIVWIYSITPHAQGPLLRPNSTLHEAYQQMRP